MLLILIILLLYLVFLGALIIGWSRLNAPLFLERAEYPFVSVIIPVRNEETFVGSLIDDLEQQDYPGERFEVIFVNDHSTDGTVDTVSRKIASVEISLAIVDLPGFGAAGISHKKAAITFGISLAKGTLILLTDGDCRSGSGWIASHVRYYADQRCQLLAGPVLLNKNKGLWHRMQFIEFASLVGTGAALIALGRPAMCNGANLSFRKKAFEEVDGYRGNENRISGDDEFLLRKIHDRFPRAVRFLKSAEGLVVTSGPANFSTFFSQRRRWAGKWKYHRNINNTLLAIFIFSVHVCIITGIALATSGKMKLEVIAGLILVKILLEFILLYRVISFFQRKIGLIPFLLNSILYSVYAVIFGIAANFGKFKWKGRSYKL